MSLQQQQQLREGQVLQHPATTTQTFDALKAFPPPLMDHSCIGGDGESGRGGGGGEGVGGGGGGGIGNREPSEHLANAGVMRGTATVVPFPTTVWGGGCDGGGDDGGSPSRLQMRVVGCSSSEGEGGEGEGGNSVVCVGGERERGGGDSAREGLYDVCVREKER